MLPWLIAIVLAICCFGLIATWLWLPARKRIEREHGLSDLADMHWREFAHIVRRALIEKRDMHELEDAGQSPGEPSADWLMASQGKQWLVSCKHGLSYHIGEAAIIELGTKIRLADAAGGLLLTQGSVDREGRELAARHRIEIIDGPALWPLLRAYMPSELESRAVEHARRTSLRRTGISALGCITFALLLAVGQLGWKDPPKTPGTVGNAAAQTGTAQGQAQGNPPAALASKNPLAASQPAPVLHDGLDTSVEDPAPDLLRRYQQQVSRTLATVEGINSAIWMTQTTLTVDRSVDEVQAMELICPVLKRYPSLRTVRVQLNPRIGIDEPVRWRQCSTI